MQLRRAFIGWALAGSGLLFPCAAPTAQAAPADRQATAEMSNEMAALKAELEGRLRAQDAEARKREEELQRQNAAELEKLRRETAERAAQERNEWQAANQNLQEALHTATLREEAREQGAAPRVGAASAGVSVAGYVQSDFQLRQSSDDQLNPTSGQPLNQDRFLIRRARLMVDVERTHAEGGLEFDGNTVNGATARLLGARASLKLPGAAGEPPLAMLTVGAFRIPFGAELLELDRARPFMERSTASRAFFSSEYDLGVRLQGGWRFVRYAVAVMNGEPVDQRGFSGMDPNHQKDIVGRLGVDTGDGALQVCGGLSALYGTGFHSGASASKPVVRWTDVDGNGSYSAGSETSAASGSAASASRNFTRVAANADLGVSGTLWPVMGNVMGKTSARAEITLAKNLDRGLVVADPYGELGRDSRELGYALAVTQMVLRHGVVGVRYDFYDPDRDRYVRTSGDLVPTDLSFYTWSFMAGVVAPWGRLLFQYDLNRNHLGLTAGGLPGNLADNAFTARAEVAF
jgi:hypothetical protein